MDRETPPEYDRHVAVTSPGQAIDALRSPLSRFLPNAALGVGLVLGAGALLRYHGSGYGRWMLTLWLAALVILSLFFWSRSRSFPRIARLDLAIPAALALFFSPLYLLAGYRWPVQVNSDEIGIMSGAERWASAPNVDPFGLSDYFAFPALLFITWGKLGNLLGGVELANMRFLHAAVGLIVIAASYALFRQLLPRNWAICASLLLGFSHSYLMISRLAMRENTAVLMEVVAFALLLWGLRHKHELATFAGGLVAGLGFYVYYPGRATFPLWILFLIGLGLFYRRRFPVRGLVTLGLVGCTGFVLMAGPILIAERNAPRESTQFQRGALLIHEEGRELQRTWVFAPTVWAGYKKNVEFGLGTFNNEVVDHAFIYENRGHGFVDPLTGILLWLGVGVVGIRLFRRRVGPEGLLLLGSFIVLWLVFAFVVNKAPNYTRLLITLPFVAYLVTEAVRWLATRWRPVRYGPSAIVGTIVAAVVVWNLTIAWDFVQKGREFGDPIGSTGRYVQSHRDNPGQQFYVASPYFSFGPGEERIRLFAGDAQVGADVNASELSGFRGSPPFALFMMRSYWSTAGEPLAQRYPQGRLRNVVPGGTHVVFEVVR
jgi:Dolichyl-phosphate-mannose-protein mannosyltransferase